MISEAYRAFHNYSTGNQILAITQCYERGVQSGPINTYVGWTKIGRHVRKGEKAITLCMPVTARKKSNQAQDRRDIAENGTESEDQPVQEDEYYTRFVYRPNWFVLSQTEGEPVHATEVPNWYKDRALATLGIKEVSFDTMDGNVMGYASHRKMAVSLLSPFPYKTLFHEIGHVELGHTAESEFYEGERTPRSLREAEAESTALLCLESLGLPDAEYCRGYIQSWLNGDPIPERSAQKIFAATDRILKAGLKEIDER